MLTKSDFMLYLDAPMHLWAKKNQQLESLLPTPFDQYLMDQGIQIEKKASQYLQHAILQGYNEPEVLFQKTFSDDHFQARADVVVYDRENRVCDIYEIKSATSVSKKHLIDAAYQRLICEASLHVRDVFLVHLNKHFEKKGALDLNQLFTIEKVTSGVMELLTEIQTCREEAWNYANQPTPDQIPTCQKPKTCPCPALCHPNLPEYPIYELPRLTRNKKLELEDHGVLSIEDIPEDFQLSTRQKRQVFAVQSGTPIIDQTQIQVEISQLKYPLYFLDYETCNPGVPMFDGYHPYQHMVFQYSLHKISNPGDKPVHFEHLSTSPGDPAPPLLMHLARHIGDSGSVIVWNKAFETSRNREMAERYPAYSEILMGINARVYDLMSIFRTGLYLDPGFHGSYSIKAVLPVLVPDFERAYADLPISKGDEAMVTWLEITSGDLNDDVIENQRMALLQYCALDSQAMLEIWITLTNLPSG
jgi:hypothetical protein